MSGKNILDENTSAKKLQRMAMEIAEQNFNVPELILIGIKENGIHIATAIASHLVKSYKGSVKILQLSMDKKSPTAISINEPQDFANRTIILVDDVANSGRTMLYALQPILGSFPAKIQTLALVERMHKQFPIALDYRGICVSTSPNEYIVVNVQDGKILGATLNNN